MCRKVSMAIIKSLLELHMALIYCRKNTEGPFVLVELSKGVSCHTYNV